MDRPLHKTTTVKVNAQVDVLIVPLVEALNRFPGVLTLWSCQGEPNTGNEADWAYVSFTVGEGTWQEIGAFLQRLSVELRKNAKLCDGNVFWLKMEWYLGGETPSASVRLPQQCIVPLSDALNKIACVPEKDEDQGKVVTTAKRCADGSINITTERVPEKNVQISERLTLSLEEAPGGCIDLSALLIRLGWVENKNDFRRALESDAISYSKGDGTMMRSKQDGSFSFRNGGCRLAMGNKHAWVELEKAK